MLTPMDTLVLSQSSDIGAFPDGSDHTPRRQYLFTSSVIPPSSSGYYPYHISAILADHETIRHEFLRCHRALTNFDVSVNPWKARYLWLWLSDYLLPSIMALEESRAQFLLPHYRNLGILVPNITPQFNTSLALHVQSVEAIALSIVEIVEDKVSSTTTTILEEQLFDKIVSLQGAFRGFEDFICAHYNRAEIFWPDVIQLKGENEWQEVLNTMMTSNFAIKGEVATTYTAAMLTSVGYEIEKGGLGNQHRQFLNSVSTRQVDHTSTATSGLDAIIGRDHGNNGAAYVDDSSSDHDLPWCNKQTTQEFMINFPFAFSEFLLRTWDDRYFKYKLMIMSVMGNADLVKLHDDVKDKEDWCSCIVS